MATNNFGWGQSDYKTGIMDQYSGIASQYNQPVTYADSPVFQAGFEKWDPSSLSSQVAKGVQKTKSGLGLQTAATAAPFGGGLYVPPIEDTIKTYSKYFSNPETAQALGEADWGSQFGHETSHLGWEYENLGKQLASISPHLKTSASNPSYAGEEQWNYMHDLMYGPRYDEEVQGRPGESYLTTKGLVNPGDLSYTPEAYNVIGESGLIPEHKKAIGFGVNPFEDTRAAAQWYKMKKEKRADRKRNILKRKIKAAQVAGGEGVPWTPTGNQQTGGGGGGAGHLAQTLGISQSQAQSVADANAALGAPSWGGLAHGGRAGFQAGGIVDLYRHGGF